MVKLIKLVKKKEELQKKLHNGLKVSSGFERLSLLSFIILYVVHFFACIWLMIGKAESLENRDSWFYNNNLPEVSQYLNAFYFIVTTMTTVGYGDASGHTSNEQCFCIILMITGVFIFSMVSGSLASILASFDQTNAEV
jgi:succinate dehydrogenase/fumarate reductase cytochrome b subunit